WEGTVFDHLAMFWAQGAELVDGDGRPIFGEGANRRAMLRLLTLLRDTGQRGASPRSVLAHDDYARFTAAAVAVAVAQLVGGSSARTSGYAGAARRGSTATRGRRCGSTRRSRSGCSSRSGR